LRHRIALAHLGNGVDPGQLNTEITTMLNDLGQTYSTIYEPALTQLGTQLSTQAGKPDGEEGVGPQVSSSNERVPDRRCHESTVATILGVL
jgi:hypothetical protein